MYFKESLSSVYHELLPDLSSLEIPTEEWLDCNNCHLCAHQDSKWVHTKCCDYQPSLSNVIVGHILNDSSNEYKRGKEIIQQKINHLYGVTPYGIVPSRQYNQRLEHSRDKNRKVEQKEITTLKCSFFHEGDCTIYQYRSDVCGAHFCRSVGLDKGHLFWKRAKKTTLFLDRTIAIMIAEKMGIQSGATLPERFKDFSSLTEKDLGELDQELYQNLWGDWSGKEANFYLECAAVFESMKKHEIRDELGKKFQRYQGELRELSATFHDSQIPDFLVFQKAKWEELYPHKKSSIVLQKILSLFNGNNTTKDIIKKADFFQLGLGDNIQQFLREKILIEA